MRNNAIACQSSLNPFALELLTEIRAFHLDKWIQDNGNCSSCLLIGKAEQTADSASFKTCGFVDGRENGSISNHIKFKTRRGEGVWDLVVLKGKKYSSDLQSTYGPKFQNVGWLEIDSCSKNLICLCVVGYLNRLKQTIHGKKTGPTCVVTCDMFHLYNSAFQLHVCRLMATTH